MGIVHKFKSMFQSKVIYPEFRPEEVTLPVLEEWLLGQKRELLSHSSVHEEAQDYINQLKDRQWAMESKIDQWSQHLCSVSDYGLREEVKSLFSETKHLFDPLNSLTEFSFEKAVEAHLIVIRKLESLLPKVERSRFSQTYDFITPEVEKPAVNPYAAELFLLKELTEGFESTITKSGIQKIVLLRNRIRQLMQYDEVIKGLKQLKAEKVERLKSAELRQAEKVSQLLQIRESAPDQDLFIQEDERKNLLALRNELNETIFNFFTQLKPALRLYSHRHPELRIIENYLNSPMVAFNDDEELQILPILIDLSRAIQEEEIVLTLEQVSNTIPLVEKAKEGLVKDWHQRNFSVKKQLESINANMKDKDFLLKVEDANYRLEHFRSQVERLREEIGDCDEEIQKNENLIGKEKEYVQEIAKVNLGRNIQIVLPE